MTNSRKDWIAGDRSRRILEYPPEITYETMLGYIDEFIERYCGSVMSVQSAGNFRGRGIIPAVTLGNGRTSVIYTSEDRTGAVLLLRYINEYCELYRSNRRLYGYSMSHRAANRTVCVYPMLPDCDRPPAAAMTVPVVIFGGGCGEVTSNGNRPVGSFIRSLCSMTGYNYRRETDTYGTAEGGESYRIRIIRDDDDFSVYASMRELLFTVPQLL